MRTLKIFGWLSHFLWATMFILCVFFGILIYSEFTNNNQQDWFIQFWGKTIPTENNKKYLIVFLLVSYVIYLLYFYAIFLFNLCVRKFEKRIFFDQSIINRFRKIGLIFIINYFVIFLLGKIFIIHSEKLVRSSTNFSEVILNELKAPMGSLIIGFFFIVLGQAFKEAKKQKEENIELKQENELTI